MRTLCAGEMGFNQDLTGSLTLPPLPNVLHPKHTLTTIGWLTHSHTPRGRNDAHPHQRPIMTNKNLELLFDVHETINNVSG